VFIGLAGLKFSGSISRVGVFSDMSIIVEITNVGASVSFQEKRGWN